MDIVTSEDLAKLSSQLICLSENDKNFQFPPRMINFINHFSDLLKELDRRRECRFFINNNNNHWSVQKHSFFTAFNKSFAADSTDKEILSKLLRELAKKIGEIKLDLYTNDALQNFVKNFNDQLEAFQASFQKNPNNLSRPAPNSAFLSDFRKRKEPVEKLKNADNGCGIQLIC